MAKIPMKAARVAAGFTQDELAEKMGVSRQTVIDWESGRRAVKPVYLYMFCGITGFSEDDILLPIKSTESRQE
jgi:putative transcriptional regulator